MFNAHKRGKKIELKILYKIIIYCDCYVEI